MHGMQCFFHDVSSLVIVRYLDSVSVSVFPRKADTPLVIDSYAILPFPISFQFLQVVRRWNSQVVLVFSVVDHAQLSQGHLLYVFGQFP